MFAWIKNWLNPPKPVTAIVETPQPTFWRVLPLQLLIKPALRKGDGYSIFVTVDNKPVAKYFDIVNGTESYNRTITLLNYDTESTLVSFNKPLNLPCDLGVVDIDIVQDNAIVASFKNIEIDHDFK